MTKFLIGRSWSEKEKVMKETALHWKDRTECPDCGGGLGPIFIIDQGHMNTMTELGLPGKRPNRRGSVPSRRWSDQSEANCAKIADEFSCTEY